MEENLKQSKKSFSKLGWIFVLGTIVIFAVQLIPAYIVGAVKPEWLQNGNISILLSIIPMYLIGMPFLIFLLKRLPAAAPEQHSISAGQFAVSGIMCYSIMYICNIAGLIVTFIIGLLKGGAVQNAILNVASSSSLILTFIYMVICAPIFEEYIFRKLLIDSTIRYGQGVAIVLSGLMFALFHGNLNQFVYAFGLGAFFAFLYVKTGKLKITIGLHMMVNFMGGTLGMLILELIDYDEFAKVSASGDMAAVMELIQNNIGGWIVYFLYIIAILALVITGIVLLIVFRKRFRLTKEENALPKGKRFSTMILNPGMLVYCLFWFVMIVIQLLQ